MCGIAGIITSSTPSSLVRERLSAAAHTLHHRGPNESGIVFDGQVGLVHTRLSIIDLAGGHQPIFTPDGSLAAVVNGEIYNYIELRKELAAVNGYEPLTRSDSECVLQAYSAQGINGFSRLNGMFALALHDRSRRRVILARDRLGIKPLYYYKTQGCVAFGSELKALLQLIPDAPPLYSDAIGQFLEHDFLSGEKTVFEGVLRVPPGCSISIDYDLNVECNRYWSLLDVRPVTMTMNEAEEAFSALMARVMGEHMRADVPFGLFLSGGVDSSLLCAMLAQFHSRPIESFSIGYSVDRSRNELDSALLVARRFGTRHTAIEVSPEEILHRIPHAIWSTDELTRDHAILPTSLLAERAGRTLRVVFSGEGGDEVFAGYARYRKNAMQRWAANILHPGSGGFRTHSRWPRRMRDAVFLPHLKSVAGGFRHAQIDAWQNTSSDWSVLQRSQHNDLVTALPDALLVKFDRSLMAFGVEGRVPFLDHRIVEFGLSLPDSLKIKNATGKYFLRTWGLRHFPQSQLFQRKKGFHVPIRRLFSDSFLSELSDALSHNRAIREWFDPEGVKSVISILRNTGRHMDQVWGLMHFAIWYRIFVERRGEMPNVRENPLDWVR